MLVDLSMMCPSAHMSVISVSDLSITRDLSRLHFDVAKLKFEIYDPHSFYGTTLVVMRKA